MSDTLKKNVEQLKKDGVYRILPINEGPCDSRVIFNSKSVINLSSNNYLGLATHPRIIDASIAATKKYGVGAGSVRTIVGNNDLYETLEKKLAEFKREEACVVYQSGLNCNMGTIQAITTAGDLIISDELNHASIIDGVKLSKADKAVYRHCDIKHLREILESRRNDYNDVLIITDGVFSMDGDIAPLPEIVSLAKEFNCMTYVDDAHGSGVLGENGRGTVDYFNLHGEVDFIIGTLSKAIGVVGGYVAGSHVMKEWLLHRSRPILFSTALPPSSLASIIEAVDILANDDTFTTQLWDNSSYFKDLLEDAGFDIGHSQTPITPVMVGDEEKTMQFSKLLLDNGVYVSAIVFPTVPKGKGRLRCMISASHSKEDLKQAADIMKEVGKKLSII